MKLTLSTLLLTISLVCLSQDKLSLGFYGGNPFGFSSKSRDFILDSMKLTSTSNFAYSIEANNHICMSKRENNTRYINLKFEIGFNNYCFSNDSFILKYNLFDGIASFGYGWLLNNKWLFDTEVEFGIIKNFEELYSDKPNINLYESFLTNNQNYYVNSSKSNFSIGMNGRINYFVKTSLSIGLQYKFLLIPKNNLGSINGYTLYNNYSNILLGLDFYFNDKH